MPTYSAGCRQQSSRLHYHLDECRATEILDTGNLIFVTAGWVALSPPCQPLMVELCCDGKTLTHCLADGKRPDVVKAFQESQGERGGPNLACGFRLSAELPSGARRLQLIAPTAAGKQILADTTVDQIPRDKRAGDFVHGRTTIRRAIRKSVRWLRRTVTAGNPRQGRKYRFAADNHRGDSNPPLAVGVDPVGESDVASGESRPIQALFVTHNLNLEGAPRALYEIACGLKRRGLIEPTILSPFAGPQQAWYRNEDIAVCVQRMTNDVNLGHWSSEEEYRKSLVSIRRALQRQRPDVVVANTLANFFVVNEAARIGIPVIWIIYESYSVAEILLQLNDFAETDWQRAFLQAKRVVFVSTDTHNLYQRLDRNGNFVILHNGIDASNIDAYLRTVKPEEARSQIKASEGKKIIAAVGTTSERKSQHLLLQAAALLKSERDDFCCYVVGLRDDPGGFKHYADYLRNLIDRHQLYDVVKLIGETPQVYDYYRAADLFVHCSKVEGYCLAILEAEAFGLPIVTTPCCGAGEQVRERVNALLFPMSDETALAEHLRDLLDNPARRRRMGCASRRVFESLKSYYQMLREYERLILEGGMGGRAGKVTSLSAMASMVGRIEPADINRAGGLDEARH